MKYGSEEYEIIKNLMSIIPNGTIGEAGGILKFHRELSKKQKCACFEATHTY